MEKDNYRVKFNKDSDRKDGELPTIINIEMNNFKNH